MLSKCHILVQLIQYNITSHCILKPGRARRNFSLKTSGFQVAPYLTRRTMASTTWWPNWPRGALPLVGGLLPRMPLSTLAEVPLKPHVHISRTGLSFHSMCQTKGGCAMVGISRAEAMFELTCDWVPQRNLGLWKAPGWPAQTRSNVLN